MHTSAARADTLRTSGVTYPGSIEHVSAVRADLRALLRDCPMVDDVILCAHELAVNAALHSHSRLPGGTFTVRAAVNPGRYIRIEVEDNGGPWISPSDAPTGHHGSDILPALAKEWGINGDHGEPPEVAATDHARCLATVADGERTSDRVGSWVLRVRLPQEPGEKFSYRAYSNLVIEPSPCVDQAYIRGERKWLAIPLRNLWLDEALFTIEIKKAFSR